MLQFFRNERRCNVPILFCGMIGLFLFASVFSDVSPRVWAQGNKVNVFNTKKSRDGSEPERKRGSEETMQLIRESMGREFSPSSRSLQGSTIYLILFVFITAVVSVLIYLDYHKRQQNKVGLENPIFLFQELCRAHELTRMEQRFLKQFAEDNALEDPLPLFIEPQYFLRALDDDLYRDSPKMIRYFLVKFFDIQTSPRKDYRKDDRVEPGEFSLFQGATTIVKPQREPQDSPSS